LFYFFRNKKNKEAGLLAKEKMAALRKRKKNINKY